MSAPVSHDPLVVNTQDGACWVRRAVTREGRGLYAVADAPKCCPEFVMATLAELAEHGLASMADALPMPLGSAPVTARQKVDEAFGIEARLFQHALDKVFSVLTEGGFLSTPSVTASLRARVAELEQERHTTNEALDDAVQALRARRGDESAETVTVEPAEDVTPQVQKLRDILAVQRAALEDQHDSPLHHSYRVGRDLPETGGAR